MLNIDKRMKEVKKMGWDRIDVREDMREAITYRRAQVGVKGEMKEIERE
jgi:hypothetical protein